MTMLKHCAFLIALLQLTLATDSSGRTKLISFGRIKFGSSCQRFLGYNRGSEICFIGPSPHNQHWYLASNSSEPNAYAIVSSPVPNKALKISCSSYTAGCPVKVVSIPTLVNGGTFPKLGPDFFFYRINMSAREIAFRSYKDISFSLSVGPDDNVILGMYRVMSQERTRSTSSSCYHCFCRPAGPPPPPPTPKPCPTVTCGLTKQKVVGRIEAYPKCRDFIGYNQVYGRGNELRLQGPNSVQQHWSFFSGSTSGSGCNPNEFMIATYPVPDQVLKVKCVHEIIQQQGFGHVSLISSCSLELVKAPCPLEYNTLFCHPGDEYLFTKEKPAADYYVLRSVLRPSQAITVSGTSITLGNYGPSSNQKFCCPPPPTTSASTFATVTTLNPYLEKLT